MDDEWDDDLSVYVSKVRVSLGGGFGAQSAFNANSGGFANNRDKPRQSDWICTSVSCAMTNFGNRTECFKCHEPKGDALDATDNASGSFKPRQITEWICTDSSCATSNFGNRTECFKCKQSKGDAVDVPSDSSGGFKPRQSDWICTDSSCGAKKFGNRTECFKCIEPKGDAVDAPPDLSGGFNFCNRSECFKCRELKGDARDALDGGGNTGNGEAAEKPKESYIPEEADDNEIFNMGTLTGINFGKYDTIPINVKGEDVPSLCNDFTDAGLTDYLQQNIAQSGYEHPTPVQKCAIPIISAGRDLMACAQTVSGKSAAFLVPIINKLLIDNLDLTPGSPHMLIVSPTRELVTQPYLRRNLVNDVTWSKVKLDCLVDHPAVICLEEANPSGSVSTQNQEIAGDDRFDNHYDLDILEPESESIPVWLQLKTKKDIDQLVDVNESEKAIMKMWNIHMLSCGNGDRNMESDLESFIVKKGLKILQMKLYRYFVLHMVILYNCETISVQRFCKCVRHLYELARDNNIITSLQD